ncbi:MAG TPA: hypothetical protein VIV11_16545 [Kofleriaceae bacterium]
MRGFLLLIFIALSACITEPRQGPYTPPESPPFDAHQPPIDSGPPCNACPSAQPSGACSHHLDRTACFYSPDTACACIYGAWHCGSIIGLDGGMMYPDAAIPPDAL